MPETMPHVSRMTLTTGARQLVVQLALEMMLCLAGSYLSVVDAQHDGDVFVGGRSRDDDLLHGRAQVRLGLGGVGKAAGGLNDDLCADGGPIQLGGVRLGEDLDLLAVDRDEILAGRDFVGQVAQDRVVLEQMGQRCRAGQVVDGNKIDLWIAKRGAQDIAANAAEAVDSNLNCHV